MGVSGFQMTVSGPFPSLPAWYRSSPCTSSPGLDWQVRAACPWGQTSATLALVVYSVSFMSPVSCSGRMGPPSGRPVWRQLSQELCSVGLWESGRRWPSGWQWPCSRTMLPQLSCLPLPTLIQPEVGFTAFLKHSVLFSWKQLTHAAFTCPLTTLCKTKGNKWWGHIWDQTQLTHIGMQSWPGPGILAPLAHGGRRSGCFEEGMQSTILYSGTDFWFWQRPDRTEELKSLGRRRVGPRPGWDPDPPSASHQPLAMRLAQAPERRHFRPVSFAGDLIGSRCTYELCYQPAQNCHPRSSTLLFV